MKILLAEDEKELSDGLAYILKRNNYTVEQAFDGEEATYFIDNFDFDLIVLDIMMPRKNGIEVLQDLRQNKNAVKVIILSAKSEIDDMVLGLNVGADDYLAKPFSSKELLARINALLRRASGKVNTDNILQFQDLKLDLSIGIIKSNSEVRLTSKELQILELLMRNSNTVISTEAILERIWSIDDSIDLNVVWVYLSNLRKKIKNSGSTCIIKSYRGLGYCLEDKDGKES